MLTLAVSVLDAVKVVSLVFSLVKRHGMACNDTICDKDLLKQILGYIGVAIDACRFCFARSFIDILVVTV